MKIPRLKPTNYGNDTPDHPPGFHTGQVAHWDFRDTPACFVLSAHSPSNKTSHTGSRLQDLASAHVPHTQAWPVSDCSPGYPSYQHQNNFVIASRDPSDFRSHHNKDGKRTLTPHLSCFPPPQYSLSVLILAQIQADIHRRARMSV